MTIPSVQLGLRIGPLLPGPAPAELMQALQSVEVTQTDSAPCTFRLTFYVDPSNPVPVGSNPLFASFNRVMLRVSVGGSVATLIDGFVTSFQYGPGDAPGAATLVVAGEDLSVAMDRVDISRGFPGFDDDAIAVEVLAPYLVLGLVPVIGIGLDPLVPYDHVPQQAGTDRQTIQQVAQRNGFVFYVTPTPVPFVNTAYWGPPLRAGSIQAVLDPGGPWSNVDSLQFDHNPLAPTAYFGAVMETTIDPNEPVPVVTTISTRIPPLATDPALSPLTFAGPSVRKELWRDQELDPVAAQATAQALTNLSTDSVVSATCELSPARLGTVVQAPGLVGVRNATPRYDGLYYLKSAAHRLSCGAGGSWDYRQTLALEREGTGSTLPALVAS